jgi:hypothetical protein
MTPKQIGYGMGKIFNAFEKIPEDKNLFVFAHYEEYKDKNGDSLSYRFKSVGNMVDGYIVPEGKFDSVIYGKESWDDSIKQAKKEFTLRADGTFPAKDSLGLFDTLPLYILNDMAIIEASIDTYFNKK